MLVFSKAMFRFFPTEENKVARKSEKGRGYLGALVRRLQKGKFDCIY
jgi:hypothetical protein